MATISLYNISDNPKKLVKNTGNALYTPTTFEPYQPLSDLTGTVLIPYKIKRTGQADLILEGANYAELNGKYYFITDRVLEPGGKLRLYLKIDVLMTYAEQIKNCPAVFDRSDCFTNQLLVDGFERVSAQKIVEYIPLVNLGDHGFNYPKSVILVATM